MSTGSWLLEVFGNGCDEIVEVACQRPGCPGTEVIADVRGEIRCLQGDPVDTSFSGHKRGFNGIAGVDAQPARALVGVVEVERKKRLARALTQLSSSSSHIGATSMSATVVFA